MLYIKGSLNRFSKESLNNLWNLIKDKTKEFKGEEYEGLREVKFNSSDDFTRSFLDKLWDKERPNENLKGIRILTSIDEAVKFLDSKNTEILSHRLSYSAKIGIGDNTALYIRYRHKQKNNNGYYYGLLIPGINYIPTKKTFNRLIKVILPKGMKEKGYSNKKI